MAFKWWKYLIKEVEKKDEDCLRRFNGMECTSCQEVCGSKAVALSSKSISITKEKCSFCGLCSSSCPTGAIKSSFKPYGLLKNNEFIFLCKKSTGEGFSSCLGWLDTGHILNIFSKKGLKKIILSPGRCGKCIPGVDSALREKVKKCQEIVDHFPGDRKIQFKPDLVKSFNREEMMDIAKERLMDNVWQKVSSFSFFGGEDTEQNKLLYTALGKLGKIKKDRVKESYLPWAEIKIDSKKCDYCGACFKLCPTGSLFEHNKDGTGYILQNPSGCTKCGLCVKICSQKALSYRSFNSLKTFTGKKDIFLVRDESKRCACCGSIIHGSGEVNCQNCKKQENISLEVRAMAEIISK